MNNGWKTAGDKPKYDKKVLCWDGLIMFIGWYSKEDGWTDGDFWDLDVTFWHELPAEPIYEERNYL